jgi:hypothetical protein
MYTVVVCSNCRFVWIVEGRPQTSQCRKCRKTRQFKKLKKYHETEDLDEAKIARAFYQSRVYGEEEHFDRALDKGILEEHEPGRIRDDEYLESMGIDANQTNSFVENRHSAAKKKSERRVVIDAFRELDNPDIEQFLEYSQQWGLSNQRALLKLEKLMSSGGIGNTGNVARSDVEAMLETVRQSELDKEDRNLEARSNHDRVGNQPQRTVIEQAIANLERPSEEEVVDYAVERGVGRNKAQQLVRKMRDRGHVTEDSDSLLRLL